MNRSIALFALTALCASTAHANADIRHAGCDLHSDYSLKIEADRLVFTRGSGHPADVVIADGSLRVDGRAIAVSAGDRQRLRDIEHGVRDALPDVKAITHAAVAIAFEAVGEVSAAFAKDGDAARASALRMARTAHELDQRIDATEGFSDWQGADVDRLVGDAAGSLAGEIAGTVAARAVTVALSGDEKGAAEFEARASNIDKNIDRLVQKRSNELEVRAMGLCSRLRALASLQSALELRLPDGSRLDLVHVEN
ncbi:DUF2884 family protein [Dokdonella soli]|uniref:DUF2884 family protein n=1 Tax=Dokdonella soli TaxID=529810 RepID=A0ABN1IK24_9GAMM